MGLKTPTRKSEARHDAERPGRKAQVGDTVHRGTRRYERRCTTSSPDSGAVPESSRTKSADYSGGLSARSVSFSNGSSGARDAGDSPPPFREVKDPGSNYEPGAPGTWFQGLGNFKGEFYSEQNSAGRKIKSRGKSFISSRRGLYGVNYFDSCLGDQRNPAATVGL
jgi:hypothetical protein